MTRARGEPEAARPWLSVAEGIGSCLLVLVCAGAVCVDHTGGQLLGRLGVALSSGGALAIGVFALRRFSGGYLNPAATLAALVARRLTVRRGLWFAAAQVAGAGVAGILLRLSFPAEVPDIHLGTPAVAQGFGDVGAIATEALIAFAWIVSLGPEPGPGWASRLAPGLAGLVYGAAVLVAGPLTGAAGNPALAFGPAFASGGYTDQEIYWLGPLLGALAAGVLQRLTAKGQPPAEAASPGPDPNDAEARYRHGLALYREGRLAEAAHELGIATELRPDWPEPYYYIGIIYRDLGDEKNAKPFFAAALQLRWQAGDRTAAS